MRFVTTVLSMGLLLALAACTWGAGSPASPKAGPPAATPPAPEPAKQSASQVVAPAVAQAPLPQPAPPLATLGDGRTHPGPYFLGRVDAPVTIDEYADFQ